METLLLDVSLKLLYFQALYLPSPLLSFHLGFKATGLVYVFTVVFWLLSLKELYFQFYSTTMLARNFKICMYVYF